LINSEAERNGTHISFSLSGEVDEIMNCSRGVSGFCEQNKLAGTRAYHLSLAIEEMLLLIRKYSHNNRAGAMSVRVLLYKDDVVISIRSGGEIFNPLEYYKKQELQKKLSASDSIQKQELLGLKLVVDMVRKTEYHQAFGVNNLIITI
jgi:anti-sigma regulatory factor (Ser/Thr protein kinase)